MELTDVQQQAYKQKLVSTLKFFKAFCAENGITYYACGGTAIGALRHNGIIPWDDDIDVCMLRKDYEKMLSLRNKLIGTGYEILFHKWNNNIPVPFAKFSDSNSTVYQNDYYSFIQGVFIDIFPLDYISNNLKEINSFKDTYIQTYDWYALGDYIINKKTLFSIFKKSQCLKFLTKIIVSKLMRFYFYQKFVEIENQATKQDGDYLMNYYTFYRTEKEIFPKEWFGEVKEVPFEDTTISVSKDVDKYLNQLFGDYMILPPKEQRESHHSLAFLDLNKRLALHDIIKLIK